MINLIAMPGEEAWKGSAVRRLIGYVAPSNYYNSMCTNQTLPTISLAQRSAYLKLIIFTNSWLLLPLVPSVPGRKLYKVTSKGTRQWYKASD
jgi:hypothetical protein